MKAKRMLSCCAASRTGSSQRQTPGLVLPEFSLRGSNQGSGKSGTIVDNSGQGVYVIHPSLVLKSWFSKPTWCNYRRRMNKPGRL